MMLLRRCFLISFALVFCAVGVTASESSAFGKAAKSFDDKIWWYAEQQFAQFIVDYPKSDRLNKAVLFQAEAQFNQGKAHLDRSEVAEAKQKFAEAINLLSARRADAGDLADEYTYWIGEAHFYSGDYSAAAETFSSLRRDFSNSSRLLAAVVEEAASLAKLGEWPRIVTLLQETNAQLARLAQEKPNSDLVVQGRLLLAEGQLTQNDLGAAEGTLRPLERLKLKPETDWQRLYLMCRIFLASNRIAESLVYSSNLIAMAESSRRNDLRAESVAFQAGVFEKLGRLDEAIAIWKSNTTSAPPERQREALLKATELTRQQGRLAEAGEILDKFLQQTPLPPAADIALLTRGELYLKRFVAEVSSLGATATTNASNLQALKNFDRLVETFPDSPLIGKAQLDRGWCFWLAGDAGESLKAFRAAAERLPPSDDLAVARFKVGEALFVQDDYIGAANNFRSVIEDFSEWPNVRAELGDHALYQLARASIRSKDTVGASNAVQQILQSNGSGNLARRGLLLMGQGYEDMQEPERARELYQQFIQLEPDSPLQPEVELALARTYEEQMKWTAAITTYDGWIERFATNQLLPKAEYYRACANFQAGNETNAAALFTSFVSRFSQHELAPQAQWWLADYSFRQADYLSAEKNYKVIFQTWRDSDLAGDAYLMAGRAASGHFDYDSAISYFTNVSSNLKLPPDLQIQARLLYGSALMFRGASETNNFADLDRATKVFGTICRDYTNEQSAEAWGLIGSCHLRMAVDESRFDESISNACYAFQQVLTNSPQATVATRSQAQVGIGQALEKKADHAAGGERVAFLQEALKAYYDVFRENNLRPGESPDVQWRNQAGWEAVRLADAMEHFELAINLIDHLKAVFPQTGSNRLATMRDRLIQKKEMLKN